MTVLDDIAEVEATVASARAAQFVLRPTAPKSSTIVLLRLLLGRLWNLVGILTLLS